MKTRQQQIATAISLIWNLSDRECDFGPKDEAILRQFGAKRLTGLRDTYKDDHKNETAHDRAIEKMGLTGAVNETAIQDFIIEKDGVQLCVLVWCGIWMVNKKICFTDTEEMYEVSCNEIKNFVKE